MKKLRKEDRNREENKKYKTLMKNDLKRIKSFLAGKKFGDEDLLNVKKLLSFAQKNVDKSVNKKIIHKNNGARKKSKLFNLINSLVVTEKN